MVGFQTRASRNNFLTLAARLGSAQREPGGVIYQGRRVRAGTFPVSIDVERFQTRHAAIHASSSAPKSSGRDSAAAAS